MKILFVSGSITNVSADAWVLPANEELKEGSGTSAAIFEAAGRNKLKEACEKIGHCDVGSAVPTPAFGADADYIIHAVVPRWKDGKHDEYGLLSSAYISSLKVADLMKCRTIAFPLLASGNNKFDKDLAFKIALESIENYEADSLDTTIIVLFGEETTNRVRSLGYDVNYAEKSKKSRPGADKADIVKKGLNIAFEWLKDEHNRKAVIALGLTIANMVCKDKIPKEILDNLKKILK